MKTYLLGLVITLFFGHATLAADAPPQELSTTPVVQNAKWAIKWWMPRHEQKLAALKTIKKVDLLFIGDSITHGWENSGKAVWAKYYAPRNAFNIGFSGDRTEHVLWRLQNGAVEGISPKVAVIMIGTNNAGHRQEASAQTATGIKAILDDLQTRLPKTKVLLLGVFPRGATSEDKLRKLNVDTNTIIKEYADNERIFFLDISDKFLDDQGNLPKAIMPDRLHPKQKGYGIWAEAMEPTLKKLLGE